MKKGIITIFAIALAMSTSIAQNLDVRAYGGVNVLQLSTDAELTTINAAVHHRILSGRPGFQYGAAVTFGERFFVQPGLQYSILSTQIVHKNAVTSSKFTDLTTLKAFSVPLKVGFRLISPETEKIFNVRLFAGLDGHHIVDIKHATKSGQIDPITADDYNNLIVNADFGMGIDLFFLFIDTGYQLGLTPVHSGKEAKSSAFYTNFGIKIGL